jgi:hypothetical protein
MPRVSGGYALHHGQLNKEFTVHGLLAKWTSLDSFLNGFNLFRCHPLFSANIMLLKTLVV